MTQEEGYLTIDLVNCARCGKNHPALKFTIMDHPSDDYRYWALCPNGKGPILLKQE